MISSNVKFHSSAAMDEAETSTGELASCDPEYEDLLSQPSESQRRREDDGEKLNPLL